MSFLQLMADSSDADVENLLVVGILEVLADEPECRRQASARLGKRFSELFDEVERFWRGAS